LTIGRKKNKLKKTLLIVLSVLIVGIAIIFILATRTPDIYQPLEPIETEEVNPYITHYLAPEFYNNIQVDEPFRIMVDQKNINEMIVDGTLDWEWPVDLGVAVISAPAMAFQGDAMLLMGTVRVAGIPMVVTIVAKPKLDEQGMLYLNFDKVKAGKLNISFLAKKITSQVIANEMKGVEVDHYNGWMNDLRDAFAENKPFDPVWPVYEDAIRLIDLEITDQKMRLVFEPVIYE